MKKIQFMLFIIGLFATISLSSDNTQRDFQVSNFNKIDLGNAFKIIISQGNTFKVSARGDADDINDLEATVSGQMLTMNFKKNKKNRSKIIVEITCPQLLVVNLSGASNTEINKFNNMNALSLRLSGASELEIQSDINSLKAILSGASDLDINGSIGSLIAKTSGASNLKIESGNVNDAKLMASGASNLELNVSKTLDIEASGASSIRYGGTPQLISMNTSGASTIQKK